MRRALAACLILVALVLCGCSKRGRVVVPEPAARMKGITLTPRSFSDADFAEFWQRAKLAGPVVTWGGDWAELADTVAGGPKVTTEVALANQLVPIVEAQFFSQASGALLRPLDVANWAAYKRSAARFASTYHPAYLGFGIEVNVLYEKSPADFDAFVPFFAEVADTVKAVSPGTKVFTIFQLELMKGLGGGLFGGVNDTTRAEWALLDRFPGSDLAAFTTYPALVFHDPAEIPDGYYAQIAAHTTKPVVFTEIGWHSAAVPVGWESSEEEQGRFVTRFFELTAGLDRRFAVWSFLYDQVAPVPFDSMGLIRPDGVTRPAWTQWLAAP